MYCMLQRKVLGSTRVLTCEAVGCAIGAMPDGKMNQSTASGIGQSAWSTCGDEGRARRFGGCIRYARRRDLGEPRPW